MQRWFVWTASLAAASLFGCHSPYHADRGAAIGGLTGAGVGALVGNATGHTGAGALIGAGVGALSGAVIGGGMDQVEEQNRADIANAMNAQASAMNAQAAANAQAHAVAVQDVVAMTQSGLSPRVIVSQIQSQGAAGPLTASDLIYLKQSGVSDEVVQALQTSGGPRGVAQVAYAQPIIAAPTPVVVEEVYYGPGPYWYGPRGCWHGHCGPRPRTSFGVSVYR